MSEIGYKRIQRSYYRSVRRKHYNQVPTFRCLQQWRRGLTYFTHLIINSFLPMGALLFPEYFKNLENNLFYKFHLLATVWNNDWIHKIWSWRFPSGRIDCHRFIKFKSHPRCYNAIYRLFDQLSGCHPRSMRQFYICGGLV